MISALRHRAFSWLLTGQLLSQFGNAVFGVVGLWQIQLRSPVLLSVAGLAMMLPAVVSAVGGAVVDRVDPRRLMLWTDLLRGAGLLLALLGLFALPGFVPGLIIAVLALNSLGGAFFNPAETVTLPHLVPAEDLPSANGLMSTTWQLSSAVGSALGGVALAGLGLATIFGFDLLSFWFSAMALVFVIRIGTGASHFQRHAERPGKPETPREPFWKAVTGGWQAIRSLRWFVTLIPITLVANFAGNGAFIMLPYWVRHVLHANVAWFGLVDAGWAGGMLCGSLLTGLFRAFSLRRTVALMTGLQALFVAGFIVASNPALAALALALAGAANGILNALMTTAFQRLIPEALQGRAFGLLTTIMTAANPLAAIVAGLTLHVLPLWWMWALLVVSGLGLGVGFWTRLPEKVPDIPRPAIEETSPLETPG